MGQLQTLEGGGYRQVSVDEEAIHGFGSVSKAILPASFSQDGSAAPQELQSGASAEDARSQGGPVALRPARPSAEEVRRNILVPQK